MISMTFQNETADAVLDDLRRIFPHLVAGTSLPKEAAPVTLTAVEAPEVAVVEEKPEPTPRTRKKKDDKESSGTSAPASSEGGTEAPLSDAASAETKPSASTASAEEKSTASASDAASVPDIEDVRAKLKTLGATDGYGHDKVFEVLAHYKNKEDPKAVAKSASTMRPADYAALITEIDALLAEVK